MQTIETPIPDNLLRLIDQKAQDARLARTGYIRDVLSKATRGNYVDDILAPFRAEVAEAGFGEDALDDLFVQARVDVYDAKCPPERH